MQLARRPLAPGEIDHEFIWLLVCSGSFTFAAAWHALKLPWPICLFHSLTGYPCATCGATRAAIALFHGQFLTAWKWNPLAFAAYFALIVFCLYALAVVIMHAPRLRIVYVASAEKQLLRLIAISIFLGNWIYLLTTTPSL
jgi:Protein of unknown function (DUF2752)